MCSYEQTVKWWREKNIKTESDIDLALDSFRVLFAYNSGKIENPEIDYHDTREVFENGRLRAFSGNPRTVFEIENQKLCYELLKPKIIAEEQISSKLIKEIHLALTGGTYDEKRYIEKGERPGKYKKHDYITGINEVGSPAEDVESDIEDMIEELKENEGKDIIKLATYLHARFEYIHPFADGNGRVGRTLTNYYLMINNHPPLIIYEEDRKAYYSALESYDKSADLSPLYDFLKAQTIKTWRRGASHE